MSMPPDDQKVYDLARPLCDRIYLRRGVAAVAVDPKTHAYALLPSHMKPTAHGPAQLVDDAVLIGDWVRRCAGPDSPEYQNAAIYARYGQPYVLVVYRSVTGVDRVRLVKAVERATVGP